MGKLKQCPVCGNEDVRIANALNQYWVRCVDCGYCGDTCDSSGNAEKAWNELPERNAKKRSEENNAIYNLLQYYRTEYRNAIMELGFLAKQCPMTDTDVVSEQVTIWLARAREARRKAQADMDAEVKRNEI